MDSQPIESSVFAIGYARARLSCRSDGDLRGTGPMEVAEHEPAGESRDGMRLLNEREYRSIVEYSPVMIWRSGLDGGCDYFNDTWLQFTGRTMDQERGNGWATGVHADDLDRCVGHYLHHFRQRAPFEMEYRLRHRDGEYRWILDRGTPVFNDAGSFEGFIGSCIDVHERHSTQDARTLAVAQEFERWTLGIVAHDLRNPLDAIVHATALARLRAEDPTAVRRNLDRIMPAVDRIQHIVNDLLDLTRERQGGVPIVRADADLAVICRDVIEELRGGATGRSITLTHEGDTRGHWDRNRVAQCVSNLLSNALKHGVEGTPVTVAVKSLESTVVIEVCNEGVIPADVMSILFLPFKPVRREGRRGGGLGLGLFIADAIARAHHGRIELRSSEPEGTCFSLWLPRNGEDSTLN